jgi:preprotein translocase subunit SecA
VESSDQVIDEDVVERVVEAAEAGFQAKVDLVGLEQFMPFMRMVLLQSMDTHWREHLAALDYLRQGIHLRGYAQKQPKQEYKREAFELFSQLLDSVKNEVTRVLLTVQIQSTEQVSEAAQAIETQGEQLRNVTYTAPDESGEATTSTPGELPPEAFAGVGRNDACPCGSGKKFKHCHGKLA